VCKFKSNSSKQMRRPKVAALKVFFKGVSKKLITQTWITAESWKFGFLKLKEDNSIYVHQIGLRPLGWL